MAINEHFNTKGQILILAIINKDKYLTKYPKKLTLLSTSWLMSLIKLRDREMF